MRIFMATAGSRGDVEPFAALARRAVLAGHQVRLVAPDRSGADLAGLDVVSLGVDYTRMIEQQGVSLRAALRSYRSVVRPVMRAVIVESARAALEHRPDVVVAHPKVLSAGLVAEVLQVPHVRVEIVPALTPTRAFPAAGTTRRSLGPLNRLTYHWAGAAAAAFRSELDEAARVVGAARRRPAPPAATLVPVSRALLRRPDDWPASVHLTGAWSTSVSVATPTEVAEFVAAGSFVYAGFGSMATGDARRRARDVVAAIRAQGARALVATGLGGLEVPADLRGDDLLVVRSVDHQAVLPHAAAAVHHGGVGTVHAATRAGTVSVVVPFIADQPFWGARLHERRLAPAPIPQARLSSVRLVTALRQVAGCRPAVVEAAAAMAAEDGPGSALQVLEGVV